MEASDINEAGWSAFPSPGRTHLANRTGRPTKPESASDQGPRTTCTGTSRLPYIRASTSSPRSEASPSRVEPSGNVSSRVSESGSAGEPGSRSTVIKLPGNARRPVSDETVSVTEGDLEVSSRSSDEPALASVTPLPLAGSEERVSALSSRLQRLERDLDPVIT